MQILGYVHIIGTFARESGRTVEVDVSMSWQQRSPPVPPFTPHLRTLNELHISLFAPQFHALETYGAAVPPPANAG